MSKEVRMVELPVADYHYLTYGEESGFKPLLGDARFGPLRDGLTSVERRSFSTEELRLGVGHGNDWRSFAWKSSGRGEADQLSWRVTGSFRDLVRGIEARGVVFSVQSTEAPGGEWISFAGPVLDRWFADTLEGVLATVGAEYLVQNQLLPDGWEIGERTGSSMSMWVGSFVRSFVCAGHWYVGYQDVQYWRSIDEAVSDYVGGDSDAMQLLLRKGLEVLCPQ